jgi:hypothetical protein
MISDLHQGHRQILIDSVLIFRQPRQNSTCGKKFINSSLKVIARESNAFFIPIGVVSKNDIGDPNTPESAALNNFKLPINPIKLEQRVNYHDHPRFQF